MSIKFKVVNFITAFLIKNKRYLYYWYMQFKLRKKERIRLSISYLYRIEHNNKFLLVKGNRINQFQPVGGVYKKRDSANTIFNELGVTHDSKSFGTDTKLTDDLRVFVKPSNLVKFIKWFESAKDRETNYKREFNEELLENEILPKDLFFTFDTENINVHYSKVKWDKFFQCHGMFIADIIIPHFNQEQEEAIKNLYEKYNDKNDKNSLFVWVNDEEIRRLGHIYGANKTQFKISETAEWTLNN